MRKREAKNSTEIARQIPEIYIRSYTSRRAAPVGKFPKRKPSRYEFQPCRSLWLEISLENGLILWGKNSRNLKFDLAIFFGAITQRAKNSNVVKFATARNRLLKWSRKILSKFFMGVETKLFLIRCTFIPNRLIILSFRSLIHSRLQLDPRTHQYATLTPFYFIIKPKFYLKILQKLSIRFITLKKHHLKDEYSPK